MKKNPAIRNRFPFQTTFLFTVVCIAGLASLAHGGQNVVVVVIDGARYADTFGDGTWIPRMWNDLRQQGTYYANFFNTGVTSTIPGHAAIVTGTWQNINNDGLERPTNPTVFEYFRKATTKSAEKCYLVTGKDKLNVVSYSSDAEYGESYGAANNCVKRNDPSTFQAAIQFMDTYHPELILINLRDVDSTGENYGVVKYRSAIRAADSLVYLLWEKIQTDEFYQGNTTLFVTADHGLHEVGTWMSHGDTVELDRHVFLFAVGKNIGQDHVITETKYQTDLAPTIGDLLGFDATYSTGTSLFEGDRSLPVTLSEFESEIVGSYVRLRWRTESEFENLGFILGRKDTEKPSYDQVADFRSSLALQARGSVSQATDYEFIDEMVQPGTRLFYRLLSVAYSGKVTYEGETSISIPEKETSEIAISVMPNPFNQSAQISYRLPGFDRGNLKIYSVTGNLVMEIPNVTGSDRETTILWQSEGIPSGIYFICLSYKTARRILKCTIIR
ncbi:MAG: alkaline phosphatase family protein [Candidatus Marinimicrobia bacterium]|nr:alkaline phosphatase family protein [Candidatus Neomarinimicrobiota bacterium]